MKIKISTSVKASKEDVKKGFTEELFMSLNPPFPPVELLRFDGCKKGDTVALKLNFFVLRQHWISVITKENEDEKEWFFIDKGVDLPFFLKRWRHKHIVLNVGSGSAIKDHISYSTGYLFSDLLMYPVLYLQFLYRKPIYRKKFRKHQPPI